MTEDKVELVRQHKEEFGLNTCLSAIGLPKNTWYYWKDRKVSYEEKYDYLHQPLLDVLEDNPAYGYRRIKLDLDERGYKAGEHVVRNLLKRWELGLKRAVIRPKPSKPREYLHQVKGLNRVKGITDPGPFQVLYTDFTQIRYAAGKRKAYLMPIIDHKTKLVVGWGVSERKDSDLALYALSITRKNLEQMGMDLEGLFIHHDRDSVYTGYRWLQAVLIRERMKISFSENGARGNTYMESFNGRFKGENADLFLDVRNIWELRRVIDERVRYYNRRRRHSALGYMAPLTYIEHEMNLPELAVGVAKIGL